MKMFITNQQTILSVIEELKFQHIANVYSLLIKLIKKFKAIKYKEIAFV